ncbi:hypothetical protein N656DRAFT_340377 [Canariomyces notabilis]|uniref:Uncharacterized protein n=1 Tax=Canariomyces notabilis TaxID=2074819 RepID=A0AAN6T9P0_9PEZI|nr:hypothetical protein N656DRAFT_340377 [Canariomyces arenarius]
MVPFYLTRGTIVTAVTAEIAHRRTKICPSHRRLSTVMTAAIVQYSNYCREATGRRSCKWRSHM